MEPVKSKREDIIDGLLLDIGEESKRKEPGNLPETLSDIISRYNLDTSSDFIEKVGKLKFTNNGKTEEISLQALPNDLKDAAFLPVNTIAEIALRQDLDMIISQIPEWFTALTVTRDAVCESDVVTGKLSRTITFDKEITDDSAEENIMSKIENTEEKLDLHSVIKNHCVFNTLEYGEGYAYVIPYAKVFEDLYKYRLNQASRSGSNSPNRNVNDMFDTSSSLSGIGYSEQNVEKTLRQTIITEVNAEKIKKQEKQNKKKPRGYKRNTSCYTEAAAGNSVTVSLNDDGTDVDIVSEIFTEQEVMDIFPMGEADSLNEAPMAENVREKIYENTKNDHMKKINEFMDDITNNIRYIDTDIALPVIEESAHDLFHAYKEKYKEKESYIQEVTNIFESVNDNDTSSIDNKFKNVKGVYIRILPATKLVPVRIDRIIIGYYYVSDLTRPEVAGQRRNSGVSGYTLRTPSIGYDTFSPDQMFCEKLATKIINNFNLKFMHDNTALHQEIVAILEQHKFNEAMLRFVFIPAEHVQQFTINKDGIGRGHSMLEPGMVTARMYMFLKLYSILYQINNSQVRVYHLHLSGIDKNYKRFVQDTMRKFAARRITANDVFNYRTSMTKVSGGSELVIPVGPGDKPPITFDTINAAEAPINNELLETLKNEAINATPVPSAMVQGAMSELDFAKEVELANTRFMSMVSSYKVDFNHDITKMYRKILRWETDIDPEIIESLHFSLQEPTRKTLSVTSEMISNFDALSQLIVPTFLTKEEQKEADADKENKGGVVREFRKRLLQMFIPQLDIEKLDELADEARAAATPNKLKQTNSEENIMATGMDNEEGMM